MNETRNRRYIGSAFFMQRCKKPSRQCSNRTGPQRKPTVMFDTFEWKLKFGVNLIYISMKRQTGEGAGAHWPVRHLGNARWAGAKRVKMGRPRLNIKKMKEKKKRKRAQPGKALGRNEIPAPPPPTQYYLGYAYMLVPSLWKHPPISGLTKFLNPPFAASSQAFPALETPLNPKHCSMYPLYFIYNPLFKFLRRPKRERKKNHPPF